MSWVHRLSAFWFICLSHAQLLFIEIIQNVIWTLCFHSTSPQAPKYCPFPPESNLSSQPIGSEITTDQANSNSQTTGKLGKIKVQRESFQTSTTLLKSPAGRQILRATTCMLSTTCVQHGCLPSNRLYQRLIINSIILKWCCLLFWLMVHPISFFVISCVCVTTIFFFCNRKIDSRHDKTSSDDFTERRLQQISTVVYLWRVSLNFYWRIFHVFIQWQNWFVVERIYVSCADLVVTVMTRLGGRWRQTAQQTPATLIIRERNCYG